MEAYNTLLIFFRSILPKVLGLLDNLGLFEICLAFEIQLAYLVFQAPSSFFQYFLINSQILDSYFRFYDKRCSFKAIISFESYSDNCENSYFSNCNLWYQLQFIGDFLILQLNYCLCCSYEIILIDVKPFKPYDPTGIPNIFITYATNLLDVAFFFYSILSIYFKTLLSYLREAISFPLLPQAASNSVLKFQIYLSFSEHLQHEAMGDRKPSYLLEFKVLFKGEFQIPVLNRRSFFVCQGWSITKQASIQAL